MDIVECYRSQGCSSKLFKVIGQIRLKPPISFFKAGLHFNGGYPLGDGKFQATTKDQFLKKG